MHKCTQIQAVNSKIPTFAFNLKGWHPRQVAEWLVEEDIYVWNGNYYNLRNHRALGLETSDGMVRVGQVHYNTMEEVRRLGEALGRIATIKG